MKPLRVSSRLAVWFVRIGGALVILFLAFLIAAGDPPIQTRDPTRGAWMSDGFQILNLEPISVTFSARFLDLDGTTAYTLSDILPPGQARLYRSTEITPPIPETFSGTLVVEADGQIALATLHLAESNLQGNMILENAHDEDLGPTAFVPIDRCTLLYIHNLALVLAHVDLTVFDPAGVAVGTLLYTIPAEGTIVVWPTRDMGLPLDLTGAAVVLSDQPIEVTAHRICPGTLAGEGAFVASPTGDKELYAPFAPARLPGLITSTLTVQNPGALLVTGEVSFSAGLTVAFSLPPLGSTRIQTPLLGGSAHIRTDQPVVASVEREGWLTEREGVFAYGAFGAGQATPAVALPLLLQNEQGWFSSGKIWLQNTSSETATVALRFVTVPSGTVLWQEGQIAPGAVWTTTLPAFSGTTAAAIAWADQPIVGLTGAFYPGGEVNDRWMLYRGTNFTPTCEPMTGVSVSWEPLTPTAGQPVLLTATVAPISATPPVEYLWDLGDGTTADGITVTHIYTAPGTYTVTLNAGNLCSPVQATQALQVEAAAIWRIYLPVIWKGTGL